MPNQRKKLGSALETKALKKAQSQGLKAKKQPLSGALPGMPNDLVIEYVNGSALIECKVRATTLDAKGKRIISIDLDWMNKVVSNAAAHDFELGVLMVRPKGSSKVYAVLDADVLLGMLANR